MISNSNKDLLKFFDATRHQKQESHKQADNDLEDTFNWSIHKINNTQHIKHNSKPTVSKHHKKSSDTNSDTSFDLAFMPKNKDKNKDKSNGNNNGSNNDGGSMHMKVQHKHTQQTTHHNKAPKRTSSGNKSLLHKEIAQNILDNAHLFIDMNNANPKTAKHKIKNIKPSLSPKKQVKGEDNCKGVKIYLKKAWKHDPHNPNNNGGPTLSE